MAYTMIPEASRTAKGSALALRNPSVSIRVSGDPSVKVPRTNIVNRNMTYVTPNLGTEGSGCLLIASEIYRDDAYLKISITLMRDDTMGHAHEMAAGQDVNKVSESAAVE